MALTSYARFGDQVGNSFRHYILYHSNYHVVNDFKRSNINFKLLYQDE